MCGGGGGENGRRPPVVFMRPGKNQVKRRAG